ncbi:BBSome-interacting protein 1 isoform X1 [Hypanus sabinus]|uniref:BBSome-interacting protein 1 isoform X1 n=2 Tax=Myliobatiformes TaxID=117851 RepID=UPI0028C4803D|nr:BBSome-interacting protein 1 isoform X1 [Hypanus sabinus]XP_059802968.1 BBSome-interacting protein 1 isoform X1 [Hypanus sabinus]
MPEIKSMFREVLPKQGQLSFEDVPSMVLCKPKLLPLKSVTLEKMEKMQREAEATIRQQELAQREQQELCGLTQLNDTLDIKEIKRYAVTQKRGGQVSVANLMLHLGWMKSMQEPARFKLGTICLEV